MAEEKTISTDDQFPTLIVDLPSKGILYPPELPMSEGTVELRYGGTKEENILMSKSYIQKQVVFDKLLKSLLVDKSINIDDLIMGDKNALIIAARRAMYGDDYKATITCTRCRQETPLELDLSALEYYSIPEGTTENSFSFESDISGKTFTYHILTGQEENNIIQTQKRMKKLNISATESNVTLRLKQQIDAIDGNTKKADIAQYIDNKMTSIESRNLREHILNNTPDIDLSVDFTCSECGYDTFMNVPLDIDFFWTTGRK